MNTDREHKQSEQQRVVRVFVSSTFRDMHDEREELVKFTFPELRKRCRERQVEFVDVDLRWGIPDEQKAEGKVLPICLAEIERCRPYFIGLLGERYGWVPEKIDEELSEVQKWLKEHREKSVTELEILHGVLKNPEMKRLSFFYFRSPESSNQIEKELSNRPNYQPETEVSHTKLIELKEEILKQENNYPVPVRKNFPDAKKLGPLVLEDLWMVIDKRFPIEKVPTALERERMEHEAFAEARRKVYIGREEYFQKLDEHVAGDGLPLVLLGESGSGKSALISNWMDRYRKEHPEEFIITHFIGSTPDSADYVRILRRIMEEIQERYEPAREGNIPSPLAAMARRGEGQGEGAIPTDPKKVVEAFPFWLAKASAKGRFILVLDALNQIEDRDNATDLGWLPEYFPPNIRVILSTLPGRSLEALKKRNLPAYPIQPIGEEERKKFIKDYLAQYRKKLNDSQSERVASAVQTANPLFLRTLLEELRVFGIHEELDNKITHYLKAKTVDDFFELVLERLEQDYDRDRPGLVRDAMSLLWASRRGLSETELLDLLGTNGKPLLRAYWSPLYLAAEESLVSRTGLLNFFHDFLRKAVEDKYFHDSEQKRKAHLCIADYFEKRELDDRKVDELPWQLAQAQSWAQLKNCLIELGMFLKLFTEEKQYELAGYWLHLEKQYDPVPAYQASLTLFRQLAPADAVLQYVLNQVAGLFRLLARFTEAEPLYRECLTLSRKVFGDNHPATALQFNNLASILKYKGDYEGAEPLQRSALSIVEKVLGEENADTEINNLGGLLYAKGDYEGAEPLYRRALAIREKVLGPEHIDTANSLNNLADLLHARGDYKEAEPLFRRALAIREKGLGREHPNTAAILNNLADLLRDKGDYEGAESLFRRSVASREQAHGLEHPDTAVALNNLAFLLNSKGDYEGAESLYRRVLAIREKVLGPEHPQTSNVLNNLAVLLSDKGDYKGAEPLYRRALAINKKVLGEEHPDTIRSLNDLAVLLGDKGDYEGAEPICYRVLDFQEKVLGKEHPDTISSINNLALLLYKKGDYERAEPLYRRALAVSEKVLEPDHPKQIVYLNGLAALLCSKGDYLGAEPLYRKALVISEKVLGKEHPDTGSTLNSLAILLSEKGDYKEAELLFRKALSVREKVLGTEHPDTAYSLNGLAALLYQKGDYVGAEPLYRKALAIRKKVLGAEHPMTANCLNNLAELLYSKGNHEEAEVLHREALTIVEKVLGEEHPDTAQSLNNLANILCKKGDYEGAELLSRRALAARQKILGPNHPATANSLSNLANILISKGDHKEAESLCREALAINEKVLGVDHPNTANCLNNLAFILDMKGDYDSAEPLFRRSLAIFEKVLGPEHIKIAQSLTNLAYPLWAKGYYEGAEPLYKRSLEIYEKVLGEYHPHMAGSLNNLAGLYHAQGRYAEAEPLYRRLMAIYEKLAGSEHPYTAQIIFNLAILLRDKGDHASAEPLYHRILNIYAHLMKQEATIPQQLIYTVAACHNNLAFHTHVPDKNWKEAEFHYKKSIELFKELNSPIENANVELNLQTMFHLSGQKVDIERENGIITKNGVQK